MKKILTLAWLTTLCLSASAAQPRTDNHTDSVYLFSYASGPTTDGIKLAYSHDQRHWQPIGEYRSFVKSDFGTWGSGKRMLTPSLLCDGGTWYAVWSVNDRAQQFATTRSSDLWLWKPQDYPYLNNGENCLRPYITRERGEYVVSYATGKGNHYATRSADFRTWSKPAAISAEKYDAIARQKTAHAHVNGAEQTGEVHKVPYSLVQDLIYKVSDAERRNAESGESLGGDAQRFQGVQKLNATLRVNLDDAKAISPDLIGIFFEDINYSADGGLYAELIQNRDFEYSNLDRREWNAQSFWELKGNGTTWDIATDQPIHKNNAHYAVLTTTAAGASLRNDGFDGIVVRKGEKYDLSLFLRSMDGKAQKLAVRLLDGDKEIARAAFTAPTGAWKQFSAVLKPTASADKATLSIEPQGEGRLALDFVSLFPQNTFKGRKNGLRRDLAETLAALKPRFVRFPGGCVSHGNGLENMYRWRPTVGPLWEREGQSNIWGYHQSKGLGFFEYFQFCEDIGAEPLPVLPAGVPCQNSSRGGDGQMGGLPMDQMDAYTQELLDLVEWANGDPKTSKLAKMRADAGHPKPFNLKMIGVGNEDLISDVFTERFNHIHRIFRQKHPEITIVGTVGPFYEGSDYEYGWELARKERVAVVDEHYYVSPGWYINNQDFYDKYDRSGTKVYLGEWASRGNRFENALAEALHIINLERNADVVVMSSYAPLLAKEGHTQWNPDLIYFNNTEVKPTVNYYVQQLAGNNAGAEYIYSDLDVTAEREDKGKTVSAFRTDAAKRVASSVVKDAKTGDLIIKLANLSPVEAQTAVEIPSLGGYGTKAALTVISGDPSARDLKPTTSTVEVGEKFGYTMPAYSFSVIRMAKAKK